MEEKKGVAGSASVAVLLSAGWSSIVEELELAGVAVAMVDAVAKKWREWKLFGKTARRSNGVRERKQGREEVAPRTLCAGRAEKIAASASDTGRTIDADCFIYYNSRIRTRSMAPVSAQVLSVNRRPRH